MSLENSLGYFYRTPSGYLYIITFVYNTYKQALSKLYFFIIKHLDNLTYVARVFFTRLN